IKISHHGTQGGRYRCVPVATQGPGCNSEVCDSLNSYPPTQLRVHGPQKAVRISPLCVVVGGRSFRYHLFIAKTSLHQRAHTAGDIQDHVAELHDVRPSGGFTMAWNDDGVGAGHTNAIGK